MSKRISLLEKIGYVKTIPQDANTNNYESLLITNKKGKKITLYRLLSEKKEIDEIPNFNNSWDIFNANLT